MIGHQLGRVQDFASQLDIGASDTRPQAQVFQADVPYHAERLSASGTFVYGSFAATAGAVSVVTDSDGLCHALSAHRALQMP